MLVGCSHPGIESIVAEAAKISPHIHFIAGGFHLVAAQDPAIEEIATSLHDTYKVDYIAPGHCTPRAASDRRASGVLDESDLRTYRTLLAQSDDLGDGVPQIVHLAQAK